MWESLRSRRRPGPGGAAAYVSVFVSLCASPLGGYARGVGRAARPHPGAAVGWNCASHPLAGTVETEGASKFTKSLFLMQNFQTKIARNLNEKFQTLF